MTPYHIQRAKIVSPLAPASERLSKAVRFDYMGSSEFEFGALPKSFRRLKQTKNAWNIRRCATISDDTTDAFLRVFSALTDEEFVEYEAFLFKLRNSPFGSVQLRERSEFSLAERAPPPPIVLVRGRRRRKVTPYERVYADFWWDIDNDVMFSFHKIFMNRLPDYVTESLSYMDTPPVT
jgi:hypothetical protein